MLSVCAAIITLATYSHGNTKIRCRSTGGDAITLRVVFGYQRMP